MKTALTHSCLVGLLVLSAACDDDERDPPPFRSGVESQAPVSELTTEQKRQICEQYGAHVNAYVDLDRISRAICLPASLLASLGNEQSCESFLANCMENPPISGLINAQVQNTAACVASLQTCDRSVVELEGCVNFNVDFVYDILSRLSCRRASDNGVMSEARRDQQATSVCAQRDNTCGAIVEAPIL